MKRGLRDRELQGKVCRAALFFHSQVCVVQMRGYLILRVLILRGALFLSVITNNFVKVDIFMSLLLLILIFLSNSKIYWTFIVIM